MEISERQHKLFLPYQLNYKYIYFIFGYEKRIRRILLNIIEDVFSG
jgi:hypothetical protein